MFKVLQLCKALKEVLGHAADEAAKLCGWQIRKGKLSGSRFAQTLVLGWLKNPASTLEQMSQTASGLGVSVSESAIHQRFNQHSAEMMRHLLEKAVQEVVIGSEPENIELLGRFTSVQVGDSTSIALPEPLQEQWPGCGGSYGAGKAALKAHVMLDLKQGALRGPFLGPGRVPDQISPLQELELEAGSMRIMDLGFFVLGVLQKLSERAVYWLSRLQHQSALFDEQGQRIELGELLRRTKGDSLDMSVRLGVQERLEARLLALRVPLDIAAERRRRLRQNAKDKGRTPSERSLALCDWTLLVTNVPPEKLSLEESLVLARARWQIELLFKLWKQHGLLDEWRTLKPWRILTEVYAKLLALLIQHWCIVASLWNRADRSMVKAAQTIRESAMALIYAFDQFTELAQVLHKLISTLSRGCRLNRRKKHPNTYQLLNDPMLNPQLELSKELDKAA